MNPWPTSPLEDLVRDKQISYGVVQPGQDTPQGVPIVRVRDVRNGIVDTSNPMRVDQEVAARHSRTTLDGGELLLSLVGTVGESAVAPASIKGWNVARAIAVLRPEDVSSRWLQLCFESPGVQAIVDSLLNTTVQATLNLSDLKRIHIPVPSAAVREGIEQVLGALDDKIAANTNLAEATDSYLAAFFHQLTQGASFITLGEIADVNPSTSKPVPGGSLRYIDISSVGQGTLDFPDISAWDDAPSRARRHIQSGDTLWSTVRPNRRSHVLVLSEDDLLVGSTGLAVLRPREIGFAYLYEATKTSAFTAYLENVAEGSAYPAVRADRFADAPVKWATPSDRESFEAVAARLRQTVQSLAEENLTLAATRDVLLPQLMSGKLQVKNPEKVVEDMI